MLDYVMDHTWLWTILVLGSWTSDYALTRWAASLLRAGADRHFAYQGGYELNPAFKPHIDGRAPFPFRMLISLAMIWGVLYVFGSLGDRRSPALRGAFEFTLGAWLLLEAAIHVRHLSNLTQLRAAARGKGFSGRLEVSPERTLRSSAVGWAGSALLYLTLWALLGHRFLSGGAAACGYMALHDWDLARRGNPPPAPPKAEAAVGEEAGASAREPSPSP